MNVDPTVSDELFFLRSLLIMLIPLKGTHVLQYLQFVNVFVSGKFGMSVLKTMHHHLLEVGKFEKILLF